MNRNTEPGSSEVEKNTKRVARAWATRCPSFSSWPPRQQTASRGYKSLLVWSSSYNTTTWILGICTRNSLVVCLNEQTINEKYRISEAENTGSLYNSCVVKLGKGFKYILTKINLWLLYKFLYFVNISFFYLCTYMHTYVHM